MKASRENKIDKIRNIAFSLFLDMGYEATSIRSICRGAGIEQPTLYYFFGSKEGLFFSIINHLWDQYKEFNAIHCDSTEKTAPEERLYGILRNSIRFAMENRRSVSFYYRYSLFPPVDLKEKISGFTDSIQEESQRNVDHIIRELTGQGIINKDQREAYSIYYTFVNNQMFNATFSDYNPSETELKELWDMFFKCRLKGI